MTSWMDPLQPYSAGVALEGSVNDLVASGGAVKKASREEQHHHWLHPTILMLLLAEASKKKSLETLSFLQRRDSHEWKKATWTACSSDEIDHHVALSCLEKQISGLTETGLAGTRSPFPISREAFHQNSNF